MMSSSVLLIGALLVITATSSPARRGTRCTPCRRGPSKPLCGSNGVTYKNKCEMKEAACKGKAIITRDYPGKCTRPDCTPCQGGSFNPLCGSDGVTYKNKCELREAACIGNTNITLEHWGTCTGVRKPVQYVGNDTCSKACTRGLFPVCDSNGITSNNTCMLEEDLYCDGVPVTMIPEKQCGRFLCYQIIRNIVCEVIPHA